jgi:ABC-2 type transport system permease protein
MLRDRMTMFWFIVFPIVMSVLFGLVIPYLQGSPNLTLTAGSAELRDTPVYKQLSAFPNVAEAGGKDTGALVDEVKKGQVALLIVLESDNVIDLHYRPTMRNWEGIIDKVIKGAGLPAQIKSFSYNDYRPITALDYIIPGMLAMTVMQIGLFGGNSLLLDRTRMILRRLKLNGVLPGDILLSHMVNRIFLIVLSVVVLVAVALLMGVHFYMQSYILLILTILFGALVFLSIGLLIASFFRSPEAGNVFTQVFNFPMTFLCGIFWPITILPGGFQAFARVLPLTPLVEMTRGMMLTGISIGDWLSGLLILACWGIVSFVLGTLLFKWE